MSTFWQNRRHARVRTLLSSYIDGEVSASEARRVAAHLSGCDECVAELESLRATTTLLGRLPSLDTPRSYALTAADVQDMSPQSRLPSFAAFSGGLATAGAAALVVVLVVGVVFLARLGFTGSSASEFAAPAPQAAAPAPMVAGPQPAAAAPAAPAAAPAAPAPAARAPTRSVSAASSRCNLQLRRLLLCLLLPWQSLAPQPASSSCAPAAQATAAPAAAMMMADEAPSPTVAPAAASSCLLPVQWSEGRKGKRRNRRKRDSSSSNG